MSGFLEAIRDNLEYVQDYQEVQKNRTTKYSTYNPFNNQYVIQKQSDSFTNKILKDIEDIQPKEESIDIAKIAMVGGVVLIVGLLLFSGAKK
jgi:hypothetical protein